jgi:3-hydroxyisobutyrate dehydrogenase-like beta-hydroxyacid dehydrogenase
MNVSDVSPATSEVLFVGLGTMGLPMAMNILRAGFRVAGRDTNADAVAALGVQGGSDGRTAEALRKATIIVTMVPDDRAVLDVLDGGEGLLAEAQPGTLVIDMSTTAPATKIALAARAVERGIAFIECPVGRTMEHAIAGTLSLMAAGDRALIERARPLLSAMGSELHICGDVGAGSAIKLINNALVASINAASIEALNAGRKANLDLETIFSVLKSTMAWNNALATGLPKKALRRDFKPGFMTRLQHKDVGLALKMADDMGIAMPQSRAAYEILDRALKTGFGADDGSGSMMRVCEAESGVVLSLEPLESAAPVGG